MGESDVYQSYNNLPLGNAARGSARLRAGHGVAQ